MLQILLTVSLLLAAEVLVPAAAADPVEFRYVLMNRDGAIARSVSADAASACPSLTLDGQTLTMRTRAIPPAAAASFPIKVCELPIPRGSRRVRIGAQDLPLPAPALRVIAALGDTGCRMKVKAAKPAASASHTDHDEHEGKATFQDCNTPEQWPFAELARNVAVARPDLVLHVGDYLYREAACPVDDAGCAGSPHGDTWPTWRDDFFSPAAPLLAAAPWIAVRGNHEICARNGIGYLILLDPRAQVGGALPACESINPSYAVQAGDRHFLVVDTSNADDLCPSAVCNDAAYRQVLAEVDPAADSWLVTHKPLWAVRKGPKFVTAALQKALAHNGGLPQQISLALAGHLHLWQLLGFVDGRAPQFVLGNGGTQMAGDVKGVLAGTAIDGTRIAFGRTHDHFGYTLFTPAKPGKRGWKATVYSAAGKKKFDCKVVGGKVGC